MKDVVKKQHPFVCGIGMSSKKVTKNDLLEAVYQNTKYEKLAVQTIMENLFDQMKEVLKDGRNPKTGQQLSVAPHYVVAFRSGQELKKALWDLPVSEVSNEQN